MTLRARLLVNLLRATADEIEGGADPGEAAAELRGMLASADAPPARHEAVMRQSEAAASLVLHRGEKPPKPSKAKPEEHEATILVRALEEHHGSLSAAAEAMGVRTNVLGTWRSGRATPRVIARLRDAVSAAMRPARSKRKGEAQEVTDAGPEPAGGGGPAPAS